VETTVGQPATLAVQLGGSLPRDVAGRLTVTSDPAVDVRPGPARVTIHRGGQIARSVSLRAATPGTYPVTVTFTADHGPAVTERATLVVHPAVSPTDVAAAAAGASATASSTEEGLAQFTPDHAIDGEAATRWSSDHSDDQWLQVRFAAPQHLGKVVLTWEAAHADSYVLETSADGTSWSKAVTVTGSKGGTETLWLDAADVRYVRVQGLTRATAYGYSIYELAAYPLA
jgi:hyaluronoglucosaminidase